MANQMRKNNYHILLNSFHKHFKQMLKNVVLVPETKKTFRALPILQKNVQSCGSWRSVFFVSHGIQKQ